MTALLETFNVGLADALGLRAKTLGELGKRMKGDKKTPVWQGPITPYHLIRGMEGVPTTLWTPSTVSPQGAKIHGCLIEDVDCDPDAALLVLLLGGIPGQEMLTEFRARVNAAGESSGLRGRADEFLALLEAHSLPRNPQGLLNIAVTMTCQGWKAPDDPFEQACAIISVMPTLVGAVMRYCDRNEVLAHGWEQWSTTGDFFRAYRGEEPTPLQLAYLKRYLLLLLSHSTNLSSSTAHMIASGGGSADLVVSAGLTALWTPAHGGAQALIEAMLDDFIAFARLNSGDPMPDNTVVDAWIRDRVGRKLTIDGVGHRVIKTQHDPRAFALREFALRYDDLANDWRFGILCGLMDAFPVVIPQAAPKITNPHVNVDFIAGPLQRMILGVKNSDNYVMLFALSRYIDYLAAMVLNGWLGGAIVRPDSVDEDGINALMSQHV